VIDEFDAGDLVTSDIPITDGKIAKHPPAAKLLDACRARRRWPWSWKRGLDFNRRRRKFAFSFDFKLLPKQGMQTQFCVSNACVPSG